MVFCAVPTAPSSLTHFNLMIFAMQRKNPKVCIIAIFFLLLLLYKKQVHLLTTIKDPHASPPWLALGKR